MKRPLLLGRGLGAAAALLAAAEALAAEPISPPGRLRDPFRPIGQTVETPVASDSTPIPLPPISPRATPSKEMWEEARRLVKVKGFTAIGNRRAALINERVVVEGDVVELYHQGFLFRWIVDRLDEKGVSLRPVTDAETPAAEAGVPAPR